MKILNILTILLAGIFAFAACDKGEMGPVMSSSPSAPSFTAPESGTSFTLSKSNAEDTLSLHWSKPDYGFSAAPSYTVEMAEQGTNFENPIQLGTVDTTAFFMTVGDMNSILIANGFPADLSTQFAFRVTASVGNADAQQVSEPVTISMAPYPPFPSIYASGSYQSASGYDIAPALVSTNADSIYGGYVYVENANSEFAFTSLRSSSSGITWGDNGGDGTLEEGGANIQVANPGYYKVTVNLNDMSYSMTNTDWGVIGSAAGGWSTDHDMTYNKETKVWTITMDLSAADIKFRANDAWTLNYGDNGGDGFLELGGANIPVSSAGNYTITMDLSGYYRTYTLSQN